MDDWRNILRRYKLLTASRLLFMGSTISIVMAGLTTWMTLFLPLYWLWPEVYWLISNHFRDVGNGILGIQWWFLGWNSECLFYNSFDFINCFPSLKGTGPG